MTEDEARKKWCPFVRQVGGTNRYRDVTDELEPAAWAPCIASDCMMWQWTLEKMPTTLDDPKYSQVEGVCGLAQRTYLVR